LDKRNGISTLPYQKRKDMKRFYLSSKDRKIGGVCGGLAEYFDIDPIIVRIVTFALIWCGAVGLWLYLLLWLLAPRNYNF